jgi:beta-lactam-binding protein with PASTA domain
VEVPNFKGMNRKQASDLAESLGLYVLMTGNQDNAATVTVQRQSIDPGAKIEIGTTIELEFVDTKVSD